MTLHVHAQHMSLWVTLGHTPWPHTADVACSCFVAQVQYICAGQSARGREQQGAGALLLSACLAGAALTAASTTGGAACEAVLCGAVAVGGAWAAARGLSGGVDTSPGQATSYLLPR